MEVASGEHGEAVGTLVAAINSGKNGNTILLPENETGIQLQGVPSLSKNITNDISKMKSNQPQILAIAKQTPNDAMTTFTKYNKNDSVINIPTNDEINVQNNKVLPASEVSTTSLLDSHDSVVTLPNKNTFPTSGSQQFWILFKRSFKTILRDKQLMHLRLASHVIVGAIIGMIYYDIGNDASKVMSNAGCIFFTTLFTMFTGMMPTILTCTYIIPTKAAYACHLAHSRTLTKLENIFLYIFCGGGGADENFHSPNAYSILILHCSSTRDGCVCARASQLLVFA